VTPRGAFSLAESIAFGFGQRDAEPGEPVMRLAFVLDGCARQVGVAVRQEPSGALQLEVTAPGGAPVEDATAQAAVAQASRVLSVDVDATGWDELGARDELLGRLQRARPGMRPPLFHSAYEALCWSVLSARRPARQMAAVRDAMGAQHGAVVEVAGRSLPVWLTPEQLLALDGHPGLPPLKLERLHGVARAALDGDLDTAALRALDPAEAKARLQRLAGIGPFYAELVVVRTLGHTDVVPTVEPTVLALAGELTGAPGPLSVEAFSQLAASWTPWRTWAAVAVRAAGPALLATTPGR
jgi:DNA-3-methyladenine glycosylase II